MLCLRDATNDRNKKGIQDTFYKYMNQLVLTLKHF